MQRDDLAPDFGLPDQSGTPRTLGGFLAAGPVVLFFYPAALTPGCTAENCHVRDLAAEFAELGAQRLGISPDPVARQAEFADRHGLDYPLLPDADGAVARRFGVQRALALLPIRRRTFVIAPDRRVLAVISSEVRMASHADRALAALRELRAHP